jgi:diaminobutyrate-2-oxoglutarate transaminase
VGFCSNLLTEAFERGLVIELAGADDDVLKFLAPLTIEEELLKKGLDIVDESIAALMEKKEAMKKGDPLA